MGWSETHRRWQVLREIENELAHTPVVREVPWRPEYAELFGDRATLLRMITYRWQLARDTQLDPSLTEAALDEQRLSLEARFSGVRRLLAAVGADGQQHAAA